MGTYVRYRNICNDCIIISFGFNCSIISFLCFFKRSRKILVGKLYQYIIINCCIILCSIIRMDMDHGNVWMYFGVYVFIISIIIIVWLWVFVGVSLLYPNRSICI